MCCFVVRRFRKRLYRTGVNGTFVMRYFVRIDDDNQMQMIGHDDMQWDFGIWIVLGDFFNAFLGVCTYFR